MLKLIASDMDGTMLDANECLPDGTYELILRLREEGIRFAATSGRRFDTLCELFEPIVDCMDFVASNGAQVIVEGELVDLEVFSHAAVKRLARVVDLFDTMHLALFDETRSYLLDDEARFEREVDKNLPNPVRRYTATRTLWIWPTSSRASWTTTSCSHRPAASGSTSCSAA